MIVCGETYKPTFERYAKELHEIAKPTTTNGKPDRKPHVAIEAMANLFEKFAGMEVPFRDLDRFCYFLIADAMANCNGEKYVPWGKYGFRLFDCTFGYVFDAGFQYQPQLKIRLLLDSLARRYFPETATYAEPIRFIKITDFLNKVTEEEIAKHKGIKDYFAMLGLSLRKTNADAEETADGESKGKMYYTMEDAMHVVFEL